MILVISLSLFGLYLVNDEWYQFFFSDYRLNAFMGYLNLGEWPIKGYLEAYSCKDIFFVFCQLFAYCIMKAKYYRSLFLFHQVSEIKHERVYLCISLCHYCLFFFTFSQKLGSHLLRFSQLYLWSFYGSLSLLDGTYEKSCLCEGESLLPSSVIQFDITFRFCKR